jgi:flagellum-specific ATP synthase
MSQVVDKQHRQVAGKLKNVLATYNEAEDLINIGAYKSGSNPDIDYAISMNKKVNEFLLQDVEEKVEFEDSVQRLMDMFEGV